MKKQYLKMHAASIYKIILLSLLLSINSYSLWANNIKVQNVSLTGQNTALNYSMVKLDLSWENSWRKNTAPLNYDAAWIIVKYRRHIDNAWHHAKLHYINGSSDGHIAPSNAVIKSSNDNGGTANGIMVFSSSYMTGTANFTGIQLRWDYGANGLTNIDEVEIAVIAIEMVYIRTYPFYLGSGGSESYHFYKRPTSTSTYRILSENAINFGYSTGKLFTANTTNTLLSYTIPSSFPKGYNGFYCMKYEISQGQYVDFLNSISLTSAIARYANKNGLNRNNIVENLGVYSSTTPYVACNYLSWEDMAAYLDWAALRPMTELEYEKVTRGTKSPVANEYAWGSSSIKTGLYSFSYLGSSIEKIASGYSTTQGNMANSSTIPSALAGPLRCGIFAGNTSNTGRTTSGASYFGAMEMSGNVSEFVIGIWHSEGRSFTGKHGDGNLSTTGKANTVNWPTVNGVGRRGGSWTSSSSILRVSYRGQCYSSTNVSYRSKEYGGRGVRSF
jgi:formylglycine-generating enzyme required for sulfatase activity